LQQKGKQQHSRLVDQKSDVGQKVGQRCKLTRIGQVSRMWATSSYLGQVNQRILNIKQNNNFWSMH